MAKDNSNIELRSEEVQDLLGQVPSWIIRWGTVVIILTVILLLAGSWLFQYPDVRRAEILVTTENPPATLVAKSAGKIEKLFVSDKENVFADQHLGLIENPAEYNDIQRLSNHLDELEKHLPDFSSGNIHELNESYSLGEVQQFYAQFIKLYQDYMNFLDMDHHTQKIRAIKLEIEKHEAFNNGLNLQTRILGRELALVYEQFLRDSLLLVQGAIAPAEQEKSETALLRKQYEYEQSRMEISSTEIVITKLNQDILDLELTGVEEAKNQEFALMEAFGNLRAQLAIWEQKYLLVSPIDGLVSFNRIWSENQNVRVGDRVLTVIPDQQGDIIGKISLPIKGSGTVQPDQRVNIKFANYPYMDYGMVKGIIRSISLVPNDENYLVEVELPEGLVTYYDIEIPFNQEMTGSAEILTDDRRLIERIINPMKSIISEQKEARE